MAPAAHGKQFTLYSSAGPNPGKVLIILKELGLEAEIVSLDTENKEHKKEPFTSINPNGRLPALVDHSNNDFAIWESGAIILYLVGKYDKEHKISFADFDDTAIANQYLMFQMSGQGPYFGQLGWFTFYHPEKLPSAIERYANEANRILGVLENILSDKEWLVGGRVSYADLAFWHWDMVLDIFAHSKDTWRNEFPKVAAWHDRMAARPSVQNVEAERKKN